MFIIERLVGISIYCFFLAAVCGLIVHSNISIKGLLGWYILVLAVMGFLYKPSSSGDLYRIFETLDWYATFPFDAFFHTLVLNSTTPASRLLYWIVGKTGVPMLLPVFSVVVCYFFIFYILAHTHRIFRTSRKSVALTLFFLMSSSIYISVVGGIRMMLALSTICFCFFRESVERRYTWYQYPLYLLAVFMHSLGLFIVAIRVFTLVFDKKRSKIGRALLCIAMALSLFALFRFNSSFFDVLIKKGNDYVINHGYSDKWEYLLGFMMILVDVRLLILYHKQLAPTGEFEGISEMTRAMQISLVIGIAFVTSFSVFYRFVGHVGLILGLPMMMVTLEHAQTETGGRRRHLQIQSAMALFSVLILLVSLLRGSLSSLKFFILK